MSINVKKNLNNTTSIIYASETKIGDLMEVLDRNIHTGFILLHTYDGFVALDYPQITLIHNCKIEVRLLSKNESVTLSNK